MTGAKIHVNHGLTSLSHFGLYFYDLTKNKDSSQQKHRKGPYTLNDHFYSSENVRSN